MLWETENGITGHLSLFLVKPVQLPVEQRLSSRTNCANLYCPAAQGKEPSSFSDPWLYSLLSSSKADSTLAFLTTLSCCGGRAWGCFGGMIGLMQCEPFFLACGVGFGICKLQMNQKTLIGNQMLRRHGSEVER